MKCTIKAKCDKETFLKYTSRSLECKSKRGYTYGFYYYKSDARIDLYNLYKMNINDTQILKGWDVDGFVTFKK